MEKAILKTLIYSDLFDYPLALSEIHRWLIGKESTIEQVERVVKRLLKKRKIGFKDGFYFLPRRSSLVIKRMEREAVSVAYIKTAEWIARFFKLIPWVLLVGISGSVAVRNADAESDIDLFIITRRNRLWLTRLLLVLVVEFFGKRRRRHDSEQEGKGKICLNLLITEDSRVKEQTLYSAHEILQMKLIWEREGMYQQFLEAHDWVHALLPNWIGYSSAEKSQMFKKKKNLFKKNSFVDQVESVVGFLQRRYMGKITGQEKVSNGALYFHPYDVGPETLGKFEKKVRILSVKRKAIQRRVLHLHPLGERNH